LRTARLIVLAFSAAAALAGCGGGSSDSGTSKAEQALAERSPKPKSVTCTGPDAKADCKVTYADGSKQECFVSIAGDSQSISCAGGEPPPAADPLPQWAGAWSTSFGRLRMEVRNGHIAGNYEFCDGFLEGTAEGNELTGDWLESEDCDKREAGSPAAGKFEFTISSSGDSFTGTWEYEDEDKTPADHAWNGERADP
jgi:hypothetical protein